VAKKKNDLSKAVRKLSSPRAGAPNPGGPFDSVNLVNQRQTRAGSTGRPTSLRDTTVSTAVKNVTGIRFGSPSNSRTPTSHSSNQLTNLLQHAASGGFASAFTNGLSGIAGFGGLVSAAIHLFSGGHARTLPPLVEFRLPQPQEQTVYVSSKGSTTFQGTAVEQASTTTSSRGIYTGSSEAGNSAASGQALRYQSGQIAQAVKNALLNSSSLNDVIAEI
jgi:hypothetical protein